MNVRVWFLLLGLCTAVHANDEIAIARKQMRDVDETVADEGVRILINIGSADAVRALRTELEATYRRFRKHDREHDRILDQLSPIFDRYGKLAMQELKLMRAKKQGSSAHRALKKRAAALKKKLDKKMAELSVASDKVSAARATIRSACRGLRQFEKDEAVAVVEEMAQTAKRDAVRRAAIEALGHLAQPRSLPVLRAMVEADKDAVRLTLAIRALVKYAREDGVADLVAPLASHRAWPVQRAAHEVLAAAPTPTAVPRLIAALDKSKGANRFRVATYLHDHTGRRFAKSEEWVSWWEGARDKPLQRGSDAAPDPDRALFGISSASRRVLFVICSRWTVPNRETLVRREDPAKDRAARMRAAVADAIEALPSDAVFNVVYGVTNDVTWFSKRMVRASGSKAKARKWLDGQPQRAKPKLFATLYDLVSDYDGRTLVDLPDTVVVLAAGHKEAEEEDSPLYERSDAFLDAFVPWNLAPGVVVHTIGYGDDIHRDALATLALASGGTYVSDAQRLPAARFVPGADRFDAPRILREAYRSARAGEPKEKWREWKALATIGVQAYPLKNVVAGFLSDKHPEWLRIAALNVLAAIGPPARDLLSRVQSIIEEDNAVGKAAKRARDAMRKP